MKRNKVISMGLAGMLALSLIGCAGKGGEQPKKEADAKEELTILIDGTTEGTDGYLIKQGALEFAKEYDVDVKFVETPYAEIHQKLMNVGASGGSDFDVVFVESDFVAQMGKAGILEPLNEYVEKSESLKWDDFVDSTVERNTLEGTVYAIPQVADVQTTIYNKEILADLGFANPPATIDEFIDYCVKAKEADYLPMAVRFNSTALPCQLMGLFLFTDNGAFVEKDGDTWKAALDNETGAKWVENVRKIFSTINADTLVTMDDTAMYDALNTGKAGCTIGGAWMYDALNDDMREKMVTAPFPKGSGDQVALMSGWNLGIFANSEHKDLAFKFLEYKADAENAGKMTAGLSGRKDAEEHFTEEQKAYYPEFQELMQYGMGITSAEFTLRSEMTTAILPVFQEVTFSDDAAPADAAKMMNDAIQKTIDENQ
ncbi:ABC transporter substrate-binding protein [Faecalicatena contorta]|uniref:ABC transporter substrate-binding protein n=1 Tax=Faecalicatena contorta TaxID=39482 RepID=UPI00189B7AD2|nr:sugar ABC transporter substrate-binding protein [Faecalicatena contorta]